MRAVTLDAVPAAPQVTEVEAPRPQAGEVLVRVAASSVNGFDAATAAGYLQGLMDHQFPLAIGKDCAEAAFVTELTGGQADLVDYSGDLDGQVRALAPGGVAAALHLAGDGAQIAGLVADGGRPASTLGFTGEGRPGRDLTFLPVMAHPDAATLSRLAADAASGLIRVPVTATYPLEQAGQAFAGFGAGALGKLAITLP